MAGSSHVTNPVYGSSSKACQLNVIKTDFSPLIFLHSSKQTSKSNTSTNYSYQTSKLLTLPQISKCLQTTENNSLSTAATVPTRGKLLSSLKSLTSNTILFTMTRRLVTLPPPKKKNSSRLGPSFNIQFSCTKGACLHGTQPQWPLPSTH